MEFHSFLIASRCPEVGAWGEPGGPKGQPRDAQFKPLSRTPTLWAMSLANGGGSRNDPPRRSGAGDANRDPRGAHAEAIDMDQAGMKIEATNPHFGKTVSWERCHFEVAYNRDRKLNLMMVMSADPEYDMEWHEYWE